MEDISQTPSALWLIRKALRSESPMYESPMYGRLRLNCNNFEQWQLDGFPELESLNNLSSKLSKASGAWYETFDQLAKEAVRLDATGNYLEAEALYSCCKFYLEQEADEQQGFDSDLANARSWVYLALANLYRFSTDTDFVDHWKATECLLSLLHITIASTSSSERLHEIRFAICLTVLEWADALTVVDPDRAEVMLMVLDEARDVVEAWKDLNELEVEYYLADKLVRGYEKLAMKANISDDAQQILLSRVEHWSEKRMLCNIHGMQIGDDYFDRIIPTMSSRPEFRCLPEDLQTGMKTILNEMEVSRKKAWIATNAGHFLEAGQQYEACVASARFSVEAAIKALPIFKPMHTLLGFLVRTFFRIHNLIGEFYWFYNMDLEKAANYFEACLLVFKWYKVAGYADLEELIDNCSDIRKKLFEIRYERAHDLKVGVKSREELLALANSIDVRKALPALLEEWSDETVGIAACENLRERYWDMGRYTYALKWNEELIKLIPKADPYRNKLLLETSGLLEQLGDLKRASEILPEQKKRRIPKKVPRPDTASRDLWSYVVTGTLSVRKHRLEIENVVSESEWPNMTQPMDDEEEILEKGWTEKLREFAAHLDEETELGHEESQSAMMNYFDTLSVRDLRLQTENVISESEWPNMTQPMDDEEEILEKGWTEIIRAIAARLGEETELGYKESQSAMMNYFDTLSVRDLRLQTENVISESEWPNMTQPMDDEEEILEKGWTEIIRAIAARLGEETELGHEESQSAMMNYFDTLSVGDLRLQTENVISESEWPNMTQPMDDEEEILEQGQKEKFRAIAAHLGEETKLGHEEFQRAMMNYIDTLQKALELDSQKKDAEAIALFQNCMELSFRGDLNNCVLKRMQFLGLIANSYFNLSQESSPESQPFLLQETIKYSSKSLRIAQERNDYLNMASQISLIGRCYLEYSQNPDPPLGDQDQAHEYITQAVYLFCTARRFLSTHLYFEKYPSPLWIAAQEKDDLYMASSYYIQMALYGQFLLNEEAKSQLLPNTYLLDVKVRILWSQALIWAERGHSRLLAFKLIERSMGANTLEQLKQFDLGHFEEALKSIQDGRDACGPDTVMIEYVKGMGPGEFFLYVLGVDNQKYVNQMTLLVTKEHFPGKEGLETLLPKLNNHMSQKVEKDENGKVTKSYKLPEDEVYQILEDLYTMFIAPIEALRSLTSTKDHPKNLVICANKNLAGVPFAALRNPDTKEFLIQRYTVMCTPSLRILKECDKRYKDLQSRTLMPGEAALVLGDPAFEICTTPLPSSGVEADNIATILGLDNVKLLKGKDALKDEVLKWVQAAAPSGQYQALMHLGTHGRGKADEVKFKEGALEFANPRVKVWPRQESHESQITSNAEEVAEEISCAGASTSTSQAEEEPAYEVGRGGPRRAKVNPLYLTAEEIVKDNEWSMLVAVLSACETARGEVKAEGILNLARALLIAGVPCTVVSQWRVEDESTSNLMVGMYSSMAKGMDVASALRNSMVRMIEIKDGFRVHQWAPFVVVGLGTVTLPAQLLARLPHSSTQSPEPIVPVETRDEENQAVETVDEGNLVVETLDQENPAVDDQVVETEREENPAVQDLAVEKQGEGSPDVEDPRVENQGGESTPVEDAAVEMVLHLAREAEKQQTEVAEEPKALEGHKGAGALGHKALVREVSLSDLMDTDSVSPGRQPGVGEVTPSSHPGEEPQERRTRARVSRSDFAEVSPVDELGGRKKQKMKALDAVEEAAPATSAPPSKRELRYDETDISRGLEPTAIPVELPVEGPCPMTPFVYIPADIMTEMAVVDNERQSLCKCYGPLGAKSGLCEASSFSTCPSCICTLPKTLECFCLVGR